jgi:hypothetical protein
MNLKSLERTSATIRAIAIGSILVRCKLRMMLQTNHTFWRS